MLILISDAFDPSLPDKLSTLGEVTTDKERLPEADVVLVRSKTKCDQKYIDTAAKLKLIVRGGVGIDNIDKAYAESKGIVVRNTPKSPAIAVAELTFALMLAVPNHVIEAHNGLQNGEWLKKQIKRTELHGKTLCLVGIGNIATEVAKRAAAFGMKVVAYDKYVEKSDWAELKPSLKDAVREADYISMHLPLTDDTKHLINTDIINTCEKKPVVINTGRGPTVDAEAMKSALESGQISFYATDVYPSDPPADDYPILKAPNVITTPHIGASSKENLLRIGDEAYAIIEEVMNGGKK